MFDRLLGRTLCRADRTASNSTREHLRARYLGALTGFDLQTGLSASEERTLVETSPEALGMDWHARVGGSAVSYLIEQALADEVLTTDEDAAIARLAELARVSLPDVVRSVRGLSAHLAVARVNDGRLPVVGTPTTRLRRREICHVEARAGLMTDSAGAGESDKRGLTMTRGDLLAYGRVIAGLVPLPADLRAWDTGYLLVTDQRVFFEGDHISIQVPHRRLIGCTVFRDGLRLQIAGRRSEPIFRVSEPLVVAAIASRAFAATERAPLPKVFSVESFDGLEVSRGGSSRSGSAPVRG